MTLVRYLADLQNTVAYTVSNLKDATNTFAAQQVSGSSTVTASTDHPHAGITGYKFAAASGANVIARLPFAGSSSLSGTLEFYYWYSGTAPPSFEERIASLRNSGGPAAFVALGAPVQAGKLRLLNTSGTAVWTATTALPGAGIYRIAVTITVATSSTGTAQIAYYAGDSTTPIETSGSLTALNLGTTALTHADIGRISTNAVAVTNYIDSIQMDDGRTTFIGPYIPNYPIMNSWAVRRAAIW